MMNLYEKLVNKEEKLSLVGLGYVGMPIAVAFARKINVVGFDLNSHKIDLYKSGIDPTHEVGNEVISKTTVEFTADETRLREAKFHIVAVPTPVNDDHTPDLSPVEGASTILGRNLTKGSVVVFESTVYPGVTEDVCVPILERESGLKCGVDFKIGYSPERINPGDKVNTLTKIKKITSGSTPEVADIVEALYNSILENGTHKAPNMKVAEAAKAVENSQRDVNISFMNELALICDRVGIDTNDVIEAAGTKWNFLKYKPGLVGGHCISVDPYYLAHKAKSLGYEPQVILSGRRVNNSIAKFIADKTLKLMIQHDHKIKDANVLMLGVTFKENCPDCRNTKVVDIANELEEFGCKVDIYDPWASAEVVRHEYNKELIPDIDPQKQYAAIIVCVSHNQFQTFDFKKYKENGAVIFDVKGFLF